MGLVVVGVMLAALVALAARDVGRPARASAAGLLALQAVGGIGLAAMAVLAVGTGSPQAALVAALAAAPLLGGLAMGHRRSAARSMPAGVATPQVRRGAIPAEERRAA